MLAFAHRYIFFGKIGKISEFLARLPFDLKRIQLPASPWADHGGHALLHLAQDIGRHRGPLGPAVGRALQHSVFNQVLFVAIVGKDHRFPFGIAAEHHVSVKDAAELSKEG